MISAHSLINTSLTLGSKLECFLDHRISTYNFNMFFLIILKKGIYQPLMCPKIFQNKILRSKKNSVLTKSAKLTEKRY